MSAPQPGQYCHPASLASDRIAASAAVVAAAFSAAAAAAQVTSPCDRRLHFKHRGVEQLRQVKSPTSAVGSVAKRRPTFRKAEQEATGQYILSAAVASSLTDRKAATAAGDRPTASTKPTSIGRPQHCSGSTSGLLVAVVKARTKQP